MGEKSFDLYKLDQNLLTGVELETYKQILGNQKHFLRFCKSICLISGPLHVNPGPQGGMATEGISW